MHLEVDNSRFKIGLVQEHLLRMRVNLDCANETEATVLGIFFGKISGSPVVTGEVTTSKSMAYVIKAKLLAMLIKMLLPLGVTRPLIVTTSLPMMGVLIAVNPVATLMQ